MEKTGAENVKPYSQEGSKKEQVARMFDNISGSYDLLNHLLSLNIDKLWRRKAVRLLRKYKPSMILDVATGTGDFAVELLKLAPLQVRGIDISAGMLEVGRKKIHKKGMADQIRLELGDAEALVFPDGFFEAVTVAFGVRNFENLQKGLSEIRRVLKPGFPLVVLEFSKPRAFPMKQLYRFYFSTILPGIGKAISRDANAYTYLPKSVQSFPEGKGFLDILRQAGFSKLEEHRLSFGIATIYIAEK